ncbi:CPBP family intramembrane glutamic endopeptidase [Bacillus massiliigorillae]|uniref:CPBP family intramembrane glutamic endopeptidase n=1 Tax=Bacillus massiliigorillae TaxID=1243664 RepID=UPI0003A5F794|nr:type II CAAX endopeptidase family protein [Bacillus massiliigorillae]
MKKEYIIVILAYLIMQFSGIIGMPLFAFFAKQMHISSTQIEIASFAYWSIFSFIITLIIALFVLRKDFRSTTSLLRDRKQESISTSILWAILGVFLAFFAQSFAILIESMIGIGSGSENTHFLVDVIESIPLFAIVTAIVGPILEELVFRKIIFGTFYKKYNFVISAFISSLIFGLAHFEFEHIILYTAMGFTFAFLYVKTNRILVPIFAHVAMNTTVVVTQISYREDIDSMLKDMEQLQSIIGGFL